MPSVPYTAWVEILADLKGNSYDLSADNPNSNERLKLPYPEKVTVQLFENNIVLQEKIQRISKDLYIQNNNKKGRNNE